MARNPGGAGTPVVGARSPPEVLPADRITILIPYGSLFFTYATTFEEELPEIGEETRHALVVLHLRGSTNVGSTALNVLAGYAEKLQEAHCRLMLACVDKHNLDEFEKTGLIETVNWRTS